MVNKSKEENTNARVAWADIHGYRSPAIIDPNPSKAFAITMEDLYESEQREMADLKSEVNKLKVVLSLRENLENLRYILEDVIHWETCPKSYKEHISKVLDIKLEDELDLEDDDELFFQKG